MSNNAPRASLIDVAKRAGVSTATVSRVLNGLGNVREDKKVAVERACEELNYVLNGAARALSSRRTRAIGAVVPTIETETFARALASFQRTVHEAGYTLLLASSGFDPKVELKEVTTLLEQGVDALMVVGSGHDPKMWERIDREAKPCVQTWSLDPNRPSVGFDHFAVARGLADHLVGLGHTRIAIISGAPPSNDRGAARIEGTRASLLSAGLDLSEDMLVTTSFSLNDGREAMKHLLALPQRPTAVVCGNDVTAFGAMLAAAEAGLVVPDDISVAGFNDFDYAAYLRPALTTVRVDLDEMGRSAAISLLRVLSGEQPDMQRKIDTELIVRQSTGPAPR